MGYNISLANNASSTDLDLVSMQVIHGAIYIVAKLFPGLTFLTQRWALLDPVCGCGPCQWPESV